MNVKNVGPGNVTVRGSNGLTVHLTPNGMAHIGTVATGICDYALTHCRLERRATPLATKRLHSAPGPGQFADVWRIYFALDWHNYNRRKAERLCGYAFSPRPTRIGCVIGNIQATCDIFAPRHWRYQSTPGLVDHGRTTFQAADGRRQCGRSSDSLLYLQVYCDRLSSCRLDHRQEPRWPGSRFREVLHSYSAMGHLMIERRGWSITANDV